MNFDRAFEILLGHEGGYTNDPKDRGNWTSGIIGNGECRGTKFGISAASFPTLDIKNITEDEAKDIYYERYWHPCRIEELPEEIRFDVFDTAVNSGCKTAIRILQNCVGVAQDGVIGSITLLKVKNQNGLELKLKFNSARLIFMSDIPSFSVYGKGWVRRVAKNLTTLD